jgi:hypothetical protein
VKNRFGRLRKSLPIAIVAIVLLLSAVSAYSQSSARDVVPVLEGLDPVTLVQGKEVQSDLKISVTRGKFQYLFANGENKEEVYSHTRSEDIRRAFASTKKEDSDRFFTD